MTKNLIIRLLFKCSQSQIKGLPLKSSELKSRAVWIHRLMQHQNMPASKVTKTQHLHLQSSVWAGPKKTRTLCAPGLNLYALLEFGNEFVRAWCTLKKGDMEETRVGALMHVHMHVNFDACSKRVQMPQVAIGPSDLVLSKLERES